MNPFRSMIALLAGMLLCLPLLAFAQYPPPNQAPPQPYTQPPTQQLSQDQLDGLLAPIALYPDELLTQVLMASTYPLEVVEAARFVKANPALRGPALDDALRDKTWDPSVLSLAPFPQVLDMMNDKLEWTQRLGDAFLADEAGVMRTVQMLRQRAQQAGNLQSNEQQRVFAQDRYIVIEPAQPQYVYVPVYNPTVIYGPWWAPAYRPWYWYPPAIWGYPPAPPSWGYAAGFYWGSGWAVHRSYWGWARPNWASNNVNVHINVNNNYWASRPQYRERYPNGTGSWSHVPEHRRGVAYRDATTYNKYRPTNPTAVQSRENFRGNAGSPPGGVARPSTLPATSIGSATGRPTPAGPSTPQTAPRASSPAFAQPNPTPSAATMNPPGTQPRNRDGDRTARQPQWQGQGQARTIPSQSMPAFQAQTRSQVQVESNRGQASRQQMSQPPDANRGQAGRQQMSQPQDANRGQGNQQQHPSRSSGHPDKGDGGSPQGKSR